MSIYQWQRYKKLSPMILERLIATAKASALQDYLRVKLRRVKYYDALTRISRF